MAILYPTSLANLVVELGTRHCHQTLLYMSWYIRSFFGFTFLNILYFFSSTLVLTSFIDVVFLLVCQYLYSLIFSMHQPIYICVWVVVCFIVMYCIRLYCVVSIASVEIILFYWLYCTDKMPINRTIKSDCGIFHTLCFCFGPQRHMRHIWFPPFKCWWAWDRVSVSGDSLSGKLWERWQF